MTGSVAGAADARATGLEVWDAAGAGRVAGRVATSVRARTRVPRDGAASLRAGAGLCSCGDASRFAAGPGAGLAWSAWPSTATSRRGFDLGEPTRRDAEPADGVVPGAEAGADADVAPGASGAVASAEATLIPQVAVMAELTPRAIANAPMRPT